MLPVFGVCAGSPVILRKISSVRRKADESENGIRGGGFKQYKGIYGGKRGVAGQIKLGGKQEVNSLPSRLAANWKGVTPYPVNKGDTNRHSCTPGFPQPPAIWRQQKHICGNKRCKSAFRQALSTGDNSCRCRHGCAPKRM